jgi:hypothetical protein
MELSKQQTQGRATNMFEKWLRCRIFKGMFSDELAVQIMQKGEPQEFSVFVPKDKVQGRIDAEGRVRVRVFHRGDVAWAVLPTENQTTVPVDESQLSAA